jgi:hypothetical protein
LLAVAAAQHCWILLAMLRQPHHCHQLLQQQLGLHVQLQPCPHLQLHCQQLTLLHRLLQPLAAPQLLQLLQRLQHQLQLLLQMCQLRLLLLFLLQLLLLPSRGLAA